MSRISIEQVKHVANLSRLAVTEQEALQFQKQSLDIFSPMPERWKGGYGTVYIVQPSLL